MANTQAQQAPPFDQKAACAPMPSAAAFLAAMTPAPAGAGATASGDGAPQADVAADFAAAFARMIQAAGDQPAQPATVGETATPVPGTEAAPGTGLLRHVHLAALAAAPTETPVADPATDVEAEPAVPPAPAPPAQEQALSADSAEAESPEDRADDGDKAPAAVSPEASPVVAPPVAPAPPAPLSAASSSSDGDQPAAPVVSRETQPPVLTPPEPGAPPVDVPADASTPPVAAAAAPVQGEESPVGSAAAAVSSPAPAPRAETTASVTKPNEDVTVSSDPSPSHSPAPQPARAAATRIASPTPSAHALADPQDKPAVAASAPVTKGSSEAPALPQGGQSGGVVMRGQVTPAVAAPAQSAPEPLTRQAETETAPVQPSAPAAAASRAENTSSQASLAQLATISAPSRPAPMRRADNGGASEAGTRAPGEEASDLLIDADADLVDVAATVSDADAAPAAPRSQVAAPPPLREAPRIHDRLAAVTAPTQDAGTAVVAKADGAAAPIGVETSKAAPAAADADAIQAAPIAPLTADAPPPPPSADAPADLPRAADTTAVATARDQSYSMLSRATVETTAHLAANIIRKLEGRSTRFDMVLTPEDLGRVDVSLEIDSDGKLAARLAFDNPAAAADLRARADELRRQLQDAGFQVASDSLDFSQRDPSSGGGAFERQQQRNALFAGGSRLAAQADLAAASPVGAWTNHSLTPDRVDVRV